MSTNIINGSPYLRTSRSFPDTAEALSVELVKSYIETAQAVNDRAIGLYSVNKPSITGQGWFFSGRKQESFRQVYTFTAAGSIAHGIDTSGIYGFSNMYGVIYDGTNWYPLPYVDVTNVNNQVSLSVSSTNIVVTAGGGSPPSISSGFVVLEWIANP